MLKEGILSQWHDDKGYGFVTTPDGTRYFLHIKAIKRTGNARPNIDDPVTFQARQDEKGRWLATSAVVGNLARETSRKRDHAVAKSDLIDWLTLALLPVLAVLILRTDHVQLLALACLIFSTIAFAAYGLDKARAQSGAWRIAEGTLHGWALLGGWPGAWLAQRVFRHKTRKGSFRCMYLATLLLNLAGIWYAPVLLLRLGT
ncbi:DUF1294 domain-containing protein [Chitinilyticum piscinae]|uniref:Cold shock and DUF1294 domain-containing protein n=1 Tax=Chitinilyticum piscinae TaxID=2866724 RepID=A0A8J7FUB0_9NEIS|nr:DUF1294 domain-containing protein [Chitinilyticum piscinae]MBE9610716.1 cold shock and DUF1294 domain-containing protein [Chitinilyticum piscinae]